MNRYVILFGIYVVLAVASCGTDSRDRENYGDLSSTSLVSRGDHPGGWGQRECLVCHQTNLNVHRGPNAKVLLDAEAISRAVAERDGEATLCLGCHGPNGVSGQ